MKITLQIEDFNHGNMIPLCQSAYPRKFISLQKVGNKYPSGNRCIFIDKTQLFPPTKVDDIKSSVALMPLIEQL